jgi:hypothetical protein
MGGKSTFAEALIMCNVNRNPAGAGVEIGYGTNLLGPRRRYQSREFMLRSETMAPWDTIRSATTVNAELVNRAGELGVAAPGARADLIAVDGDPLADISLLDRQREHLTHIVKNGVFHKTKKFQCLTSVRLVHGIFRIPLTWPSPIRQFVILWPQKGLSRTRRRLR